jgi:hypothetical protein
MSGYAIFAFVVTPAIVLALAVLLFLVDEHVQPILRPKRVSERLPQHPHLISGRTVVVSGYGGWDDIFTRALIVNSHAGSAAIVEQPHTTEAASAPGFWGQDRAPPPGLDQRAR